MRRLLAVLMLCCSLVAAIPSSVAAAPSANKGLLISPLRSYISINAGSQKTNNFTIANLTEKTILVTISVKQFSVSDYAYDYRFSTPNNNWLSVSKPLIRLQPGESQTVSYTLNIPSGTAPGGNYYTLFASANISNSGLDGTVQAATLLYITIIGTLTRTSEYKGSAISRFMFGHQLSYTFDVKNTGNVHYFAYFSGKFSGLFSHPDSTGTSHLLLPGSIRQVSGTIPAPLLPGVYRATYSYVTDGNTTITKQRLVIFIPPWSIAFVLFIVLALVRLQHRKRHIKKPQIDSTTSEG